MKSFVVLVEQIYHHLEVEVASFTTTGVNVSVLQVGGNKMSYNRDKKTKTNKILFRGTQLQKTFFFHTSREQVREDNEDLGPVYQEMAQVVAARDGLATEVDSYRRELTSMKDALRTANAASDSIISELEKKLQQAQDEKAELELSLDRWKSTNEY